MKLIFLEYLLCARQLDESSLWSHLLFTVTCKVGIQNAHITVQDTEKDIKKAK